MAYIPESAKWYLAEIVEEIIVEGDARNVVHTNLVLVRADSPEEAYEKAVQLGTAVEMSYENLAGKRVTFRFRGLHDLNVIHAERRTGRLPTHHSVNWTGLPVARRYGTTLRAVSASQT